MKVLLFVFFGLLPGIVAFAMFFIGAKRVQKNSLLWGVWGALSFLIPVIVLGPIAWSIWLNSARATGEDAVGPLFFSIGAITIGVGVFASILVYKKILVKVPTVANTQFAFCSECGTQCSDNRAFCSKCGNKLSGG